LKIEKSLPIQREQNRGVEYEDRKFREAAQMYEQQFIREMVKAMRSTVDPSGLVEQNFAEKIFREKLDDEYVQGWSNRGGVGLGDIIFTQLKERFGSRQPEMPPAGPIPLNSQPKIQNLDEPVDEKKIHLLETPQQPHSSQFLFQGPREGFDVTSPWSGKVSQVFAGDEGRKVLEIQHNNGLTSKLVFEGQLGDDLQGRVVEAGEKLGSSIGSSSTLSWRVTKKV
jgi:flagellar protein FlgJ